MLKVWAPIDRKEKSTSNRISVVSCLLYIVQEKWVTPLANFFAPSHVLLVLAFLMLILAEGLGFLVLAMVALVVGTISALLGILYATTANDLKTMLAHSSIENVGIVVAGFGSGMVFVATNHPALAAMAFVAGLYHDLHGGRLFESGAGDFRCGVLTDDAGGHT
jgi:NADH:ubiquinone oxidoreductase subunit 2 (subunit N)